MGKTAELDKKSHAPFKGKRSDMIWVDPESITIIGIDTNDGPEHPLYHDSIKKPLSATKIANVKKRGVRYPVLCRKNADLAECVDGRTRIRWARAVNAEIKKEGGEDFVQVPMIMFRGTDKEALELAEELNAMRGDHADETKMEKVARAQRLITVFGFSEEEAGTAFGIGPAMIKNWLALQDLVPEVQAKVNTKELTVTKAVRIAKTVRREKQKEAATAAIEAPRAPSRPSREKVLARTKGMPKDDRARICLLWSIGEATDEQLEKVLEKAW